MATALFWGVKLFVQGPSLPDQVQLPTRPVLQVGDLARLLGASVADEGEGAEPAAAGSERFTLIGVVAPRGAAHSSQGVALIAVDGQPAKAFKTGSLVVDDLALLSVEKRLVRLGPKGGPSTFELSLPEPEQLAAGDGSSLAPSSLGRPMGMQGGFPGQPGAQGVARPGLPVQPGQVPGQPQDAVDSDDEEEE